MFTFVTIAYQLPYYTQHANIYYHTKKNKYYLFLPGNRYITIGHNDLQKGEIYAERTDIFGNLLHSMFGT